MKKLVSVIFVCCLSMTDVYAQNLVPNPDFETRDADFCGIAFSNDLANSLADWYSPSGGTPDVYFTDIDSSCWNYQPNSAYPGPIGLKGEQLPQSGTAMTGLGLYTIAGMNQREYIQVELTSPLVVTGKYLVECYVSLGDFTEFASNNIGFHLSTNAQTSGSNGLINVTPQYFSTDVVGETQNWVRVVDTITVTESYQYLTIGNFSDDASTSLVANPSASGEPGTYGAYYFIDDVRVERVFTDVSSVNELETIDVRIFPNPASNEIRIELKGGKTNVEIELLDVQGKTIWTAQEYLEQRLIVLSDLDDGVYFIRIESDLGTYSERIVKQ